VTTLTRAFKGPPLQSYVAQGPRNKALGYALSLGSIVLATWIRVLAEPWIGLHFPFATLFLAVTATAAYGGFGPGLAATGFGIFAAIRFMLPPHDDSTVVVEGVENQAGLALYVLVSLAFILIGNGVRRARNRAESVALQASRDRDQMRTTLASIEDAVIVTDAQAKVLSMNSAAENLTGWTSSDAYLRSLDSVVQVVNEATRRAVESPAGRVLREGVGAAMPNVVLIDRGGRDRFIDSNAAPMRDANGVTIGVVLVFREILERRREEAAHRLLASIVESSQDAIYGKSLDGTIASWNAAAERLYGYAAHEVIGQPSTILTPADRLGEQSAILVQFHDTSENFETVRRRKDGALIHISTTISPVRNEAGVVVGSSTIARDITPQKRAQEDLQKAQEQLREANQRKDEFIAILAHELRNPLAPLRNALGILKVVDASSLEALEARNTAERQVHHLTRLVDDLLDVSRITHGRIELQRKRLELKGIVRHAVENAQGVIDSNHHELTVTLPDEAVWLDVDEVRIVQVLSNLLNNAAQYTAPGGKIALSAAKVGGAVEIRVSDTGLGIAADALPRVFDLFTQVSPKEVRTPHSLGIGLRLVKGLVEMHGGRVEALSAGPGRGSVFVVRLPVAEPPDVPGLPPERSTAAAAPPKRSILIVDDNVDAAESLATLLGLDGHETRVACDGPHALDLVAAHPPDIMLLDIGMPGMDGYEVARRVRQGKGSSRLTLVALTGWGQERDRQRAAEAGFDHHLTKPVEPLALNRIIAGGDSDLGS
jgi:PAS domain S-box-containing protein